MSNVYTFEIMQDQKTKNIQSKATDTKIDDDDNLFSINLKINKTFQCLSTNYSVRLNERFKDAIVLFPWVFV